MELLHPKPPARTFGMLAPSRGNLVELRPIHWSTGSPRGISTSYLLNSGPSTTSPEAFREAGLPEEPIMKRTPNPINNPLIPSILVPKSCLNSKPSLSTPLTLNALVRNCRANPEPQAPKR